MGKVLVVEDQRIVGRDVKSKLEKFGHGVTDFVDSGPKTLESIERETPDLILMDINLKGEMDGIETVEKIHENRDIPVAFMTAYSEPGIIGRIKETTASGYILKPLDDPDLETLVEAVLTGGQTESRINRGEVFPET